VPAQATRAPVKDGVLWAQENPVRLGLRLAH
jgi:hypothetical protein